MSNNIMKTDIQTATLLKNKAIKTVDNYLSELINNPNIDDTKKASNISYWINDYINYIRTEDKFVPHKNMNYKRGDIVKVNLGFNIGCEEGGLHYAIVINNPTLSSGLITVVPMTSFKSAKKLHYSEVFLGNTIFEKVLEKLKIIVNNIENQIRSNNYNASLRSKQIELLKFIDEAERMKKSGSIALIEQITTVSKQRIHTPTLYNRFLEKIRLSNEDLDRIDNKICELFLKNKNKTID